MPLVAATSDWSDPIAIAAPSLLQAQVGRLAILGSGATPGAGDPGTILATDATVLFGPGNVRIRAIDRGAALHHQPWVS